MKRSVIQGQSFLDATAFHPGYLLGHLKSDQQFIECSLDEFKRHYMLKLYGLGYTQYSAAEDMNEISETGMEFLVDGLLELEKKLSQADTLAESKTWPWFEEEKI